MNTVPLRLLVVRTPEARQRLAAHMTEGNRDRVLAAPVSLVVAADTGFHAHIPTLAPHMAAYADVLEGQPEQRATMARTNALIQVGYLIVGLRAAGLAAGPMGGMDAEAIDREFFAENGWTSLLVVNVGHVEGAGTHRPRGERLSYARRRRPSDAVRRRPRSRYGVAACSVPVATGRSGSFDHCDHDPGYSAASTPIDRQRGDLVRGRDPGPAVHGHRPVDGEPRRRSSSGRNRPSASRLPAVGHRERTGDVARPRVDRLHLPRVPLGRAGVEQRPVPARGTVGVDRRQATRDQDHVARLRLHRPGLDRQPRRRPGRDAAVEQPHVAHTAPAQQPPHARRGHAAHRVVGHHRAVVAHAPASGRRLQLREVRQRMTARPGGRRRGELGVEVDVHRTGHMGREVVVVTVGPSERPPHVEQHGRLLARQQRRQPLGVHQDRVPRHAAPPLPRSSSRIVHASMFPGW